MPFYLSPIIGTGQEGDGFTPVERPYWPIGWIDLRPDPTVRDGYGLLYLPETSRDSRLFKVGDHHLDDVPRLVRRLLANRLALAQLDDRQLNTLTFDLLMQGEDEVDHAKRRRWRKLRPGGVLVPGYRIYIGGAAGTREPIYYQPVVIPCVDDPTYTETWPTNGTDLTTGQDLTWTEDENNCEVSSNRLRNVDTDVSCVARMTTAMPTEDMDAKIIAAITTRDANIRQCGVFARKINSTVRTGYRCDMERGTTSSDECELAKFVSGGLTTLSLVNFDVGAGEHTVRVRADGSTIVGWSGPIVHGPVTDTGITGNLHSATDVRSSIATDAACYIETFEVTDLVNHVILPVGAGAKNQQPSDNLYLSLPAGLADDDILIADVFSTDNVAHSLSGWTEIAQFNGGGTSRLSSWWKRYAQPSQTSSLAFDAATESSIWTTTPDPFTFDHTPTGTPRGVLVFIDHGASADHITSVTYGGVTMERVGIAQDTAGEPGRVYIYFLGASIPTGTQTISIDHTAQNETRHAVCVTLTAGADTEIGAASLRGEADLANPSVALVTAVPALRCVVIHSGLPTPSDLTMLSDMSAIHDHDYGARVSRQDRQTARSAGTFTIGYTSASDDVAMFACAVQEVGGINTKVAHSGGGAIIGRISAYRGCKTTGSPINATGATGTGTADATIEHTGITPTVDGCMLRAVNGTTASHGRTPPTHYTAPLVDEQLGGNSTRSPVLLLSIAAHEYLQAVGAATGTVTDTSPAATDWGSVLYALEPEPVAAGSSSVPNMQRYYRNRRVA